MCYNTSLERDAKALERYYNRLMMEETRGLELPFRRVVAFSRPWWPMVTTEQPEAISWKQWGLVPYFAKGDPKAFLQKSPTFNAISEEAEKKPSFRDPWKRGQRCLIPVTSFREWQHRPVTGRKTPYKVPHDIALRGQEVFSLAGLWEGDTYTVLTRPANTLMAEIHNSKKRMPVIIPRAYENDWLQPNLTSEDVLRFCMGVEEHDLIAESDASEPTKLF